MADVKVALDEVRESSESAVISGATMARSRPQVPDRDLGSRRCHRRGHARGRGMVDDPRGGGIGNVAD